MSKKLETNDIDYIIFATLWITADQANEFNYILRIPITNMNAVRSYYKEYRAEFLRLLKAKPSEVYDNRFEYQFIENLIASGEDVERILLWLQSIDGHAVTNEKNITGTGAYSNWYWYFFQICQDRYIPINNDKVNQLIATFRKNVFLPEEAFQAERKISDKNWLSGYRSEYDEFLWKDYFQELQMPPSTLFFDYIKNIYFRRWWKKYQNFLTMEEKEDIFNDLVKFIQDPKVSDITITKWEYVWPIDQAIDIKNIPDFELYAKEE